MRKLNLMLATTVAILSAGTLATSASAMTPAGLRAAVEDTAMVDKTRTVCTHFWNGHWHPFEQCFWAPDHHRHHHHHGYRY